MARRGTGKKNTAEKTLEHIFQGSKVRKKKRPVLKKTHQKNTKPNQNKKNHAEPRLNLTTYDCPALSALSLFFSN
jgi:hypothetical protein